MTGRESGLLRERGEREPRVTFMELFFDLVFVFAVTQLAHLLLANLTAAGAAQTLLLLLAVWWAWVYTAWVTNWFNPDHAAMRLLLVGGMLASLLMAAALPEAFGAATVAAFVAAFLGSVALWWIYFDRTAEDSSGVITRSADPGRLGRSAYTYFHLPMIAGVIVAAVGDELTIAHPTGPATLAATAAVLGGHALFKRAVFQRLSAPRLGTLIVLAALAPFGPLLSPLLLTSVATLVVASIALLDARMIAAMRATGARA